jgi:hypothetical protein
MKRALAIVTAVTAFATFPLYAEEEYAGYLMRQNGEWPTSWPKELDPLRHHAGLGRFTGTFWRSGKDQLHFGIRFTTREECEAAWPHLLKVKSKGAPIILRSGPSFWLGWTSHGVCVHQQPAIWRVGGGNLPITKTPRDVKKLLSAQEVREKTINSIELFVDGRIVGLNRISLPKDTLIIDKRVKDTEERENEPQTASTPAIADDDATEKPASRKLRDFAPDDPVVSMYDHLSVQVTDPAKTEAIKKELAKYGRVIKGGNNRFWGADVYDDVDTDAAQAALAKVGGVGNTGTRKRGAYDKRIPDLEATLNIGKKTYAIDQADVLELTFILTNISKGEPREFLSVDSTFCQLDLKLEGPGAQSSQIVKTRESTLVKRGKVIRLEPGKSYKILVTNLTYGGEYSVHRWKWTKPGEYTLTAAYTIGEVRYEAAPVKLNVIDK